MNDRQPTLTPMPSDFYWAPRCHLDKEPTGLFLHGQIVVSMIDRIDGGWFALLHLEEGISSPTRTRQCSSFEAGRRGAEEWARRHEAALQARVAKKISERRGWLAVDVLG